MNPVSPIPIFVVLFSAYLALSLIVRRYGGPEKQARFRSVEGLRGYLALFVFLHHSCIWYFYSRSGKWEAPPSNLYTNLGEASVAMFFMVSGFLFFSKLIDGRTRTIDWGALFVSRFLRLVPLYVFAMLAMFCMLSVLSHGTLHTSPVELLKSLAAWIGFTAFGNPDVNGVANTYILVAGATWSLPYEWFFYLSLPVWALLFRVVPPAPYLALGAVGLAGLAAWRPELAKLAPFLGGIAAAMLVRFENVRAIARTRYATAILIACLATEFVFLSSGFRIASLALLSISFILIACGNDVFGILTSAHSRRLGEMAYSIYLLHGLALFLVFNFLVGRSAAGELSPAAHWAIVVLAAPAIVAFSFLTYNLIERPAMERVGRCTSWLRGQAA